jgi:hypothetical protein
MRDPRFDWDSAKLYHRRQDERAEAVLARFPDLGPLEDGIAGWWSSLGDHSQMGTDDVARQALAVGTRAIGDRIDTTFREITDALAMAILEGGDDEPPRRAALMELGKAIGATIATGPPNARAFDAAVRFLSRWWPAEAAFERAFVAALPPAATSVWVDQLRLIPRDVAALLGHYSHREPPPISEMLEEERSARLRGIAGYLWRHQNERCSLGLEWSRRADVLLALSPEDFVRLMEELPLLELRDWVVRYGGMHEDRDTIIKVLSLSAPVFAGGSWTGRVMAMIALENSLKHVEDLLEKYDRSVEGFSVDGDVRMQAEKTLPTFQGVEIPDWFKSVMDVLSARRDGADLAAMLSAKVIHDDSTPAFGGRRRWSAKLVFVDAVRARFGLGLQAQTMRQTLSLAGPRASGVSELSFLTAAAVLCDDADGVWQWYVELLSELSDEICTDARGGTGLRHHALIAGGLLGQSDQVTAWKEAWRLLFQRDRDRARFGHADPHVLLPSQHLVGVGIGMLNRTDRPTKCSDAKAGELWRELCRAAQWLAYHRNTVRVYPGFEASVFRMAEVVFGDHWPLVLDENLTWLLADEERQVFVGAELLIGGVDRDVLLAEMGQRGCDPLAAFATVQHRSVRVRGLTEAYDRLRV